MNKCSNCNTDLSNDYGGRDIDIVHKWLCSECQLKAHKDSDLNNKTHK